MQKANLKRSEYKSTGLIIMTAVGVVLSVKIYCWSPYLPFFQARTFNNFGKLFFTVAFSLPPTYHYQYTQLKYIDNELYIYDLPTSDELKILLAKLPPPEIVKDSSRTWSLRLETLAKFVSKLLPETSTMPHSPEPVRASILLGLKGNSP